MTDETPTTMDALRASMGYLCKEPPAPAPPNPRPHEMGICDD